MMQHQQTKLAEEEERTMIGLLMHYTENQSPPHPLRYEYDKGSEMLRGQRGFVCPSLFVDSSYSSQKDNPTNLA